MSNPINTALGNLLPGMSLPVQLISTADNYVLQSKQKVINLRPDEESARYLICAQLAVESQTVALKLPPPSRVGAPVAPKMYANLMNIFRNSLGLSKGGTSRTPSNVNTPRKRAAAEIREGSPSPSPKKRGGPKSTDPTSQDVERMAGALGISDAALEAVVRGYKQYHNLVRERWGLLCGLYYVIISRAHPQMIRSGGKDKLCRTLIETTLHTGMTPEKLEEWIEWAERIVGEQRWVQNLAVDDWIKPDRVTRRKCISGIGNMIGWSMDFGSQERIEEYQEWEEHILERLEA